MSLTAMVVTVTTLPALATLVAAETVKLVGLKIAKVHVSLTMSMKHGRVMATAMTVRISQPITVAMNAQQVLRFG
jgi:hypothetical protein